MGDEVNYYPGKTNVRMADVIVVNKVNVAPRKNVQAVAKTCAALNRRAVILRTSSEAVLDRPELVKGKKVLVVEDGPSVTHGGLSEGAGAVAARAAGGKIVSPKENAVGSIRKAYEKFPQLGDVLPALGYSDSQLKELERSINAVACDAVVLGTPSDITRMIHIRHPVARVTFEASEVGKPRLEALLRSNRRLASAVRGN
jgi:predicted GTPase